MKVRLCPCGCRLERKPKESEAAFEKRQYCDGKCRAKYHKPAPPAKAFGVLVPQDKTKLRVGGGMLNYLYGRPV